MHHPAAPETEWPTCITPRCNRRLWATEAERWACRPCEEKTATRITELPVLFRQLDTTAALMKGASRTKTGVSGSRTAPVPPRLDVLALVGPGGVAARLQAIEDSWRQALGWQIPVRDDGVRVFAAWRSSPAQAVPAHSRFLANNLLWACERHESVGQDIDELRRLHGECTALVGGERRAGRVKIGACPVPSGDSTCGTVLTATADSHRVRCSGCGARWETLGEWRDLRAAQERVLAEAAGVAA
ncbi:hypothetical protein PV377_03200 [Streptomyces ipomoeae]|uniref:hypothetical protein n=1 Tax=Streptomyces ipomoeae TaxID=103232 RepID=UPI0029B8DC09|nr:hypothetical protein [Streptomyces ipomoeae]MDX2838020.1 hypothetical protein [Streptomyces ipomoeae]